MTTQESNYIIVGGGGWDTYVAPAPARRLPLQRQCSGSEPLVDDAAAMTVQSARGRWTPHNDIIEPMECLVLKNEIS